MTKYLYDKVTQVIHLFAPELHHSSRHCSGESPATVVNDASVPLYASPNYAVYYLSALYQLSAHSLSFAVDATPATTAVFSCKINSRLSILAGVLTPVHSLSIVCYTSTTVYSLTLIDRVTIFVAEPFRCSGCTHEFDLHRPVIVEEATQFFNDLGVLDFTFDSCKLVYWLLTINC